MTYRDVNLQRAADRGRALAERLFPAAPTPRADQPLTIISGEIPGYERMGFEARRVSQMLKSGVLEK
jgi:hypothetical protein